MNHYVNVYEYKGTDDELVRRYGPFSEHRAERFEFALDLNIDHDRFYCLTVEEDEA